MAAKPTKPPRNYLNNNITEPTESVTESKQCLNKQSNSKYNSNNNRDNKTSHNIEAIESVPQKPTCNCSNISIMHLFHEMKQEFSTIPDHIVSQCVNENCHEREKCIQLLRNELALNPIPVQAYPAKVLQRQQQQQKLQQQQQHQLLDNCNVSLTPECTASPILKDYQSTNFNNNSTETAEKIKAENVSQNCPICGNEIDDHFINSVYSGASCCCTTQVEKTATTMSDCDKIHFPTTIFVAPRRRPTTLSVSSEHQHRAGTHEIKPTQQHYLQQRPVPITAGRAPLPPLPPKSIHLVANRTPPALKRTPHEGNRSLLSPSSSVESELSVDVGSTDTAISTECGASNTMMSTSNKQEDALKSTSVRHRSVVSVQPEPPYSRHFLSSPSSCGSCGGSGAGLKSFTTVNLTLRQPNTSVLQSTIDISAGPSPNDAGGTGLTYSSTSYDARRGCQKNFHIRVSDEGGVFSASRIRPSYSPEEQKLYCARDVGAIGVNILPSPLSEYNTKSSGSCHQQIQRPGALCSPREKNESTEVLQRQAMRRNKLSSALLENKRRLHHIEQEINILTEPINAHETERLDAEIQRLRADCVLMLNEIENSKRSGPNFSSKKPKEESSQTQSSHPLPRQRSLNALLQRHPMDFVQHHVISATPTSQTSNSPNQQQLPPLLTLHSQQGLLQQQPSTDEEDYSDSNTEGGDEEYSAGLEMWACNMCTFRNHPQLNICECCENVRILPGMIRIVPSNSATSAAATTTQQHSPSVLLSELSAS